MREERKAAATKRDEMLAAPFDTPWNIGNQQYPLHPDLVEDLPANIHELSTRWRETYSHLIATSAHVLDVDSEAPCCAYFGVSGCKEDISDARKERLGRLRSLLCRLVMDAKGPTTDGVSDLRLYLLWHAGLADDQPPAFCVILVASFIIPATPIFLDCAVFGDGQPGTDIRFNLDFVEQALHTAGRLAIVLDATSQNQWRCMRADYTYKALDILTITHVRCVEYIGLKRKARDPVMDLLNQEFKRRRIQFRKVGRGRGKSKRKAKGRGKGAARGKGRGRAAKGRGRGRAARGRGAGGVGAEEAVWAMFHVISKI